MLSEPRWFYGNDYCIFSVFTQKSIGESLMNPGHMRIKSDLKLDNKGYSDVNTLLFRVISPLFLKYGNRSPELRGFPSWGGMFSKADLSEIPQLEPTDKALLLQSWEQTVWSSSSSSPRPLRLCASQAHGLSLRRCPRLLYGSSKC